MKYDSRLNGIWKCCAKEESRYSLNAARLEVESGSVIATDGHILTAVNVTDLLDKDEKSFFLPVDAMKFAQALSKKDKPVVRIEARGDAVVVSQGGLDQRLYYPKANTFPKWEAAIPEKMDGYEACVVLSAELLLALSESLQGGESINGVCLWIKGPLDRVVVTHPRVKGKYSVMMPMRSKPQKPEKYWATKKKEVA